MPARKSLSGTKFKAEEKQRLKQPRKYSEALGRIHGLESEMVHVIRDMEEKVQQLECLNSFSSLLNSTLDPHEVREKALEATCKLLGCETASLLLVDEEKVELYWETALGDAGKQLQDGIRLAIDDQSIAGYVAMSGESLIVNNVKVDPRYSKTTQNYTHFETKTMCCIPLKIKEKTIGVLQALNKLHSVPVRHSTHSWPDFYDQDRRLLETLGHQVSIAIENSRLYSEIKHNFFETVEVLAEAIEKKDRYTGGHTKRVVHYAECVAKYMDLRPEQLENVRLAAILHDVGKIGIEDKILKKDAPLDAAEWVVMKTHPELGFEIMSRVEGLKDVMSGVRLHHERWDGKGYPFGMKGEEIPLLARIIAVADTYDAMVSTRPYRKGMDPQIAYDEILKNSGSQFDPMTVEAFKKAFKYEKMGKGSGGSSFGKGDQGGGGMLSNCD